MSAPSNIIDLTAALQAQLSARLVKPVAWGWVVHCARRGGYLLRRGLPPERGHFVGLTQDLRDAEFFTDGRMAEIAGFWQQGVPVEAVRRGEEVELI